MKIKGIVNKLIKENNTNDPFEIAHKKGINIIFKPFKQIYGFYSCYKRYQFIYINQNLSSQEQKFVCAHELAHAILHRNINTPFLKKYTLFSTDKIEKEANTFAVELLMPDHFLYQFKNENTSIYEAAQIYGVPKEFAKLKRI